jgi:hypothetical protein
MDRLLFLSWPFDVGWELWGRQIAARSSRIFNRNFRFGREARLKAGRGRRLRGWQRRNNENGDITVVNGSAFNQFRVVLEWFAWSHHNFSNNGLSNQLQRSSSKVLSQGANCTSWIASEKGELWTHAKEPSWNTELHHSVKSNRWSNQKSNKLKIWDTNRNSAHFPKRSSLLHVSQRILPYRVTLIATGNAWART